MKKILTLMFAAFLLAGCTNSVPNEPHDFKNEEFVVSAPASWIKDNVNNVSFVTGYFFEDQAIAHFYRLEFEEDVAFRETNQEVCDFALDLWLTTFSYPSDSIADTESTLVEDESFNYCKISYSLSFNEEDDEVEAFQEEELKVYFKDNTFIIGHFVESDNSEVSDEVRDIMESFSLVE